MGCPYVYYKLALQYFAHALVYEENSKLAKELAEESSDDRLEAFILEKKIMMSEKDFYYIAGTATQCVLDEAYQEGCDPLNASIGGLDMFEKFIGLEKDKAIIQEWHDAKINPPQESGHYIVTLRNSSTDKEKYYSSDRHYSLERGWYGISADHVYTEPNVTHWMPFPEPWKEIK